ncbi:protein Dok-7 [Biomphalaria glabrata]|nr:serine/arginine repetitive matrix protein 1 [Biomphalaria glabrata]
MADAIKVVEGKIKFREGKKWKPRWCIIKKPSPVADQLQVLLYKDVSQAVKEEAKPKTIFTLEAFFGLDAGIAFDKELHVLAIICHKSTSLMAFEQREHMIQFEIKIRQSLGEEHQFPVTVVKAPSSSRLAKDQVRLVIHDLRFCLIAQTPPKILLSWNIEDLRRFGANDNKFCFEGGSRCGKGTGVFALQSEQAKDIEDIVQLASMGKMSNGHRRNLNRSSQVDLSSHLIADMLPTHSSSYIHHHPNSSSPQAPLPVTLNCCYDNQTGSAESEDWSWYKRHSVSVMDHHRIVASRDNVDHFIGIYDVPPNHGRKIAEHVGNTAAESNYHVPRNYPEIVNSEHVLNNDYCNYKQITYKGKEGTHCGTEEPTQDKSYDLFNLKVNALARKSPSPSVSREESLQRLQMQESHLQREMVLLDEILQNCAVKNSEKQGEELNKDQSNSTCSPNKLQHRLNNLEDNLTIISGNISPFKMKAENPMVLRKMDRTITERLNTSMPEPLPASPLCQRKVKNILAPLPYVNLSRYDDESFSHVHFPGSSESIPTMKDSGLVAIDAKHVKSRSQSNSLVNLNTPSNTHYATQASGQQCSKFSQQNRSEDKRSDNQEILFVKLDDSSVSNDPIIYASLQCMMDENINHKRFNNDLVKVFTSDAGRHLHEENYVNCEAIYENLPLKVDNDLPPELPPKGPALLKKLQAAYSNRQIVSHSNIQQSQSVHTLGESNLLAERSAVNSQDSQEKKLDLKEDNYCMMGSPKIRHKLSVVPESPFRSGKSPQAQCLFKGTNVHVRGDYMDMGVIGSESCEDEIYLDVDAARDLNSKDLYISEADLKLASMTYERNMSGECTYMDMSCVPNRKSMVVPSVDSIHVTKTPGKDTAKQNQRTKLGPAPPPPCPPRPMTLTMRQDNHHIGLAGVNLGNQNKAQPVKSATKVYTKAKKSNHSSPSPSEPPMPFPNLIDFTKKMTESRSTYVNTYIDSAQGESYIANRDVQLPEPAKEGFLARFKRRSSKDKNALQLQEKSNKNRNSVLERSMSEHEASKAVKDEKTSKLKLGRRRSSSFPNRLSYQESLDGSNVAALSQVIGSSCILGSSSSKPNSPPKQKEQSESSSSIKDVSDDSDMSPLLTRVEKKMDSSSTVLHVQQSSAIPRYPYSQIQKPLSAQGGSSKTDDEKLIEMIQQKNSLKKPIMYQRSSSLELKSPAQDTDQSFYLKLPKTTVQGERRFSFEKLIGCNSVTHSSTSESYTGPPKPPDSSSFHQTDARNEHLPPNLPPKMKSYQVPLSPVLETSPPIPTSTEPLYVELDEVKVFNKEKETEGKDSSQNDKDKR